MDFRFLRNVFLKGLTLFLLMDLALTALPVGFGKISLYNHIFPGRKRFPFGEDSSQSYNLSLFNLDAMYASHHLAAGLKPADEYRVILIGDSSVWGTLLRPDETLAGQLDSARLTTCAGKKVRVYNLGYPSISLTKDLMVLDNALRFDPDLIVWGITLEAFPRDKQLSPPIVAHNTARMEQLIDRYNLPFDIHDQAFIKQSFWDRTLIGQRKVLADLFRLQIYGVLWAATGIDQTYPLDFTPAQTDFEVDTSFHDLQPPVLEKSKLAFEVLQAGMHLVDDIPVILFNEPILISNGRNSDIRYNFLYPRWAYDQWREMMTTEAVLEGWVYLDLWSLAPAGEFTNSAIHLTPYGESVLAGQVKAAMGKQVCP